MGKCNECGHTDDLTDILKEKNKWLNQLLKACEFLSKDRDDLPDFVKLALEYPDNE